MYSVHSTPLDIQPKLGGFYLVKNGEFLRLHHFILCGLRTTYIANGLFSESFGLPEMCWRAPVHLDIFHVIILCETDLLFNKLYLQIYYRFFIQI